MSNCPLCNLGQPPTKETPAAELDVSSASAGSEIIRRAGSSARIIRLFAVPQNRRQEKCAVDPSVGIFRRAWRGIQWIFPTAVLVLIPKCPLCVAAYVGLFTGVGITVATARWIQISMLVFCVASLGYIAVKTGRRFVKNRSAIRTAA